MRSKETNKPYWALVLLAGGTGSRMMSRENKLFLPVGGMPVLIHALKRMLPHADHTVIVYHPGELERIQEMILNWHVCHSRCSTAHTSSAESKKSIHPHSHSEKEASPSGSRIIR